MWAISINFVSWTVSLLLYWTKCYCILQITSCSFTMFCRRRCKSKNSFLKAKKTWNREINFSQGLNLTMPSKLVAFRTNSVKLYAKVSAFMDEEIAHKWAPIIFYMQKEWLNIHYWYNADLMRSFGTHCILSSQSIKFFKRIIIFTLQYITYAIYISINGKSLYDISRHYKLLFILSGLVIRRKVYWNKSKWLGLKYSFLRRTCYSLVV